MTTKLREWLSAGFYNGDSEMAVICEFLGIDVDDKLVKEGFTDIQPPTTEKPWWTCKFGERRYQVLNTQEKRYLLFREKQEFHGFAPVPGTPTPKQKRKTRVIEEETDEKSGRVTGKEAKKLREAKESVPEQLAGMVTEKRGMFTIHKNS